MQYDLRHAIQQIPRRPGVAALVVTTLAIGIAATTVVFSLADAILWHPLPFSDAERFVRVRVAFVAPPSGAPLDLDSSLFDGVYPFQLNSAIVKVAGGARAVTDGVIRAGLVTTYSE